jgi:hypothetical protein
MLKKVILLGSIFFASKGQQSQWIVPSRMFPVLNETIDLKIKQGNATEGQLVNLQENSLTFKHFGPRAQKVGIEGNILKVNFVEGGIHVFTINQENQILVVNQTQWNRFLEEKDVKYQVANLISGDKTLIISHFNKSILKAENQSTRDFETETQQKLEIIPLNNPFEGGRISLKVLFNGEIMKGITILHNNNAGNGRVETFGEHTDKNGVVNFDLSRGLHTFEVVKIEENGRNSAEYQVFISSLTIGKK